MKILTLSTSGERCGIAAYNTELAEAMRSDGLTVDIHPIDSTAVRTLPERELSAYFKPFLARLEAYDALIIQHEYGLFGAQHSLVAAQRVFARVLAAVAASGKPTVVVFHAEPRTSTRLLSRKRMYWERTRRLINANPQISILVHGDEALAQYVDAGLKRASLWTTRHPLQTIRPVAPARSNGTVTLTIFGFVATYKGYDEAVAALALLPERFRLLVAGGAHPGNVGDDTLARLMAANDPRIEVTGWIDEQDVGAVMARTDIVLAPYHPDGPPGSGAITWAIRHGRPVIASETISFREIQREAGCFAMVAPLDPQALADAILKLADDEAEKARLVEAGFAYARSHSWEGLARRVVDRLGGAGVGEPREGVSPRIDEEVSG
ncbi:glycosyltransferase [Nitratireductor pacificus]|uniref:WbeA n=1 Tax=Nitratireductor pacificus pht-3B TaxID=391937 RepID=K2M4D1_9HYPH|nr:glycosyltransferase [Nitratireductor pacificus]EKF16906.1 WbeA [Nitratireductor pacificus pht-3B]